MPLAPQAVLLAAMLAGRYRPGRHHHHHNGFLQHLFATDPWLGALVLIPIVIIGVIFALVKRAGRVLEGTPWYIRLALLASAGFGIFRLLSRQQARRREDAWHPAAGWQPGPPPGRSGPDDRPGR